MVKLYTDQIDWNLGLAALGELDPSGQFARFEPLVRRAKTAIETAPLTVITHDFVSRAQDAFLDEIGTAYDDGTRLYEIKPPYVCFFAVPSGGYIIMNNDTNEIILPPAFNTGAPEADLRHYCTTLDIIVRSFTYYKDAPQITHYKDIPPSRVVRRVKGKMKTVKQPGYSLVTLHPGAEVELARRSAHHAALRSKRGAPIEHEVTSHWRHYNLDETCGHIWEDITTEEVLKRERCTKCGAKRVMIPEMRRGDPNKAEKRKVVVLK